MLAMSPAAFADAPTYHTTALSNMGTEVQAMNDVGQITGTGNDSPAGDAASKSAAPSTSSAAAESGAYALGGAFLLITAAGDQRRRRARRS